MRPAGRHCPFLNRADDRCGAHFQIDDLRHAYARCFSAYKLCPVYFEMLIERRARRSDAAARSEDAPTRLVQLTITPPARRPSRVA